MWNPPTLEELSKLPSIADSHQPKAADRLVYMHLIGHCSDWYIVGFDAEPETLYGCVATGRPRDALGWQQWELPFLMNYSESDNQLTRNMGWGDPMRAYDPRGPI